MCLSCIPLWQDTFPKGVRTDWTLIYIVHGKIPFNPVDEISMCGGDGFHPHEQHTPDTCQMLAARLFSLTEGDLNFPQSLKIPFPESLFLSNQICVLSIHA